MNLDNLFNLLTDSVGDVATFQGLQFNLETGVMIVDFVKDVEFELEGGGTDIVDGFVIDFVPLDELSTPMSFFALDKEGLEEIIEAYILPRGE